MAELKAEAPRSPEGTPFLAHPSDEMTDREPLRRKRNIEEVESTDPHADTDRLIHQRKRSRETDIKEVEASIKASTPAVEPVDSTIDSIDDKESTKQEGKEDQEIEDIVLTKVDEEKRQPADQAKITDESEAAPSKDSDKPIVEEKSQTVEGQKLEEKPEKQKPEDHKSEDTTKAASDVETKDAIAKPTAPSPFASVMSGSTSNNFFIKSSVPAGGPATSSPFSAFGKASSTAFGSSGLAWGFSNSAPPTSEDGQEKQPAFKAPKPFGAPASDGEEEGDDDNDGPDAEDDDLRAEAKRLGDHQQTTGEEGEETIYKLEAKFFVLVKDSNGASSWVERGNGIVKLNRSISVPVEEDESESDVESENSESGDSDPEAGSDDANSTDAVEVTKTTAHIKDTEDDKPEESDKKISLEGTPAEEKDTSNTDIDDSNTKNENDTAAKTKELKGKEDAPNPSNKRAVRVRLLMRSHKALHVALNCPIHKVLKYGDVKGEKPAGGLFYFTWPQESGKYDMCLLKAAVPSGAPELWENVKKMLECM